MPITSDVDYAAEVQGQAVRPKADRRSESALLPVFSLSKDFVRDGVANTNLIDIISLIQEDERVKLGNDLHDGVAPLLVVANLYLSHITANTKMEAISLGQVKSAILGAIENIRNLSHQLAASQMLDGTLVQLIKRLVETTAGIKLFKIRFIHDGNDRLKSIRETTKRSLYRIVQEQLNNIIKHSSANSVEIRMSCKKQQFSLVICDDGVGFNSAKRTSGIGLTSITTRIKQLNGDLRITTSPGMGCTVGIVLPFSSM